MSLLDNVTIGMVAEHTVTVTSEMTISHFANMPQVYATPMMVLHMEMAAGSTIASCLPEGFVSVGINIKVRHLAATPIVGRTVRAISRVIQIDTRSVVFEVEAWDGHPQRLAMVPIAAGGVSGPSILSGSRKGGGST